MMGAMPEQAIDVGSTLAALARTLDSDELRQNLGLTTAPAPSRAATGEQLGALELSGNTRWSWTGASRCRFPSAATGRCTS